VWRQLSSSWQVSVGNWQLAVGSWQMSLKYGEAFNFEISKLKAFFYGVLFFAEKAASRFLLRLCYLFISLSRGLKMLSILLNFKIN
jgi:hypothetical protein